MRTVTQALAAPTEAPARAGGAAPLRRFRNDVQLCTLLYQKFRLRQRRKAAILKGKYRAPPKEGIDSSLGVYNLAGTIDYRIVDRETGQTHDPQTGQPVFHPDACLSVFRNAKSEPAQFAAVIIKMKLGHARLTVSNFYSGKTVATGATTPDQLYLQCLYYRLGIESVCDQLTGRPKCAVTDTRVTMRNWVLAGYTGFPIDLAKLHRTNLNTSKYDPRSFPGNTCVIPDVATIIVFDSSNYIVCGMSQLANVEDVSNYIYRITAPCRMDSVAAAPAERNLQRRATHSACLQSLSGVATR